MGKRKYKGETFTGRKYWEDEKGNRDYEGETFTGRKYRESASGERVYEGETFTGRKYREAPDGSREYAGETFTGRKYWEDAEGNRTYEGETFTGRKYEEKDDSGGCFLTTACVEYAGLPDDCKELKVMRHFRDTYVAALPEGPELIAEYYRTAPPLVEQLRTQKDGRRDLHELFETIQLIVDHIESGLKEQAMKLYQAKFSELRENHLRIRRQHDCRS